MSARRHIRVALMGRCFAQVRRAASFPSTRGSTGSTKRSMTTLMTVSLIDEDGRISMNCQRADAALPLAAEHVERLIEGLGLLREQLQPPVRTRDPVAGEQVQAQLDPRWWVAPEMFVGGALLQLRHTRFGWLAFALPLQSLRDLHKSLGDLLAFSEQQARAQKVN